MCHEQFRTYRSYQKGGTLVLHRRWRAGRGDRPSAGEIPCAVCNSDSPAGSHFPCDRHVPQTWTGATKPKRSRLVGGGFVLVLLAGAGCSTALHHHPPVLMTPYCERSQIAVLRIGKIEPRSAQRAQRKKAFPSRSSRS